MLYTVAAASGLFSVLASWLGLVNRGEETKDRLRWYASIVVAVGTILAFAGVVGAVLYRFAGVVPWVASVARVLAAPMAWVEARWRSA